MSERYEYVVYPTSARTSQHLIVKITPLGNTVMARCVSRYAAESFLRALRELKDRRDTEHAYNLMVANANIVMEPV
jgi:hypothetical protein